MLKLNFSVSRAIYCTIFAVCCLHLNHLFAQIEINEEPKRLYYDRTQRVHGFWNMHDMRDVTHKDKFLMGKNRITGNFSYNMQRIVLDDGHELHNEIRSALGFYSRIRFFEEFSINTSFYKDFNPKADARWVADYTYAIGRYNWKPNKFNYGYENYLNNKYTDNSNTFLEKFLEGYYFVSYSNNLFKKANDKLKVDSTSLIKFTYFARYAFRYQDANNVIHSAASDGKPTVGAGFRYTVFWNIYVETAAYFYPIKGQKQPWDPDYSYGFGYFDWRSFRVSLTYGNWAVNRFPWNETFYKRYGFFDGNFRLVANFIW